MTCQESARSKVSGINPVHTVARHLLARETEHDPASVRRVVRELSLWAGALGSEPAKQLLSELHANGTLTPPDGDAAKAWASADFTSLPPWLR